MRIFCPNCASSELKDLPRTIALRCEGCGNTFNTKDALIKFTEAIAVAKGLTHPIRRSILLRFGHQSEMSAVELSEHLNLNLSKVSYHVKVLKDCGILTPTKERKVGGATEHFFRVNLHFLGAN